MVSCLPAGVKIKDTGTSEEAKNLARKSLLVLVVVLVAVGVVLAGCTQTAASPTPAATAKPAATTAPAGSPAAGGNGQAIFQRNCNGCHPNGGQGAGPALTASRVTEDQIKTQVRNGKGAMPAFPASQISDADLNVLATYVKGLQR
jgi:mono/diheme cytochrome c family protein